MPDASKTRSIRKAAILVASLDPQTSDALLAQLPADQVDRVKRAVLELDHVDPAEQEAVIDEFFRIGPLMRPSDDAGVQLDDSLAEKLSSRTPGHFGESRRSDARFDAKGDVFPSFDLLKTAGPGELAALLGHEHPQTVAVVVSQLPRQRAAEVLAQLPADLQAAVVRRLVDLEQTDPDVLRDVEQTVQSLLARQGSGRLVAAGLDAVQSILSAATGHVKKEILRNIAHQDGSLAGRLGHVPGVSRQLGPTYAPPLSPPAAVDSSPDGRRRPQLTFDDLDQLDDDDLRTVISAADAELVILALTGFDGPLVGRILAHLPRHHAKVVRRALERPGPTRLSDVESAREQLARGASTLAAEGRITDPRRRLSVAA